MKLFRNITPSVFGIIAVCFLFSLFASAQKAATDDEFMFQIHHVSAPDSVVFSMVAGTKADYDALRVGFVSDWTTEGKRTTILGGKLTGSFNTVITASEFKIPYGFVAKYIRFSIPQGLLLYDIEKKIWEWEFKTTSTPIKRNIGTHEPATPDIKWRIENDTLFVNGKGEVPGYPPWLKALSEFSVAIIGDSITSLGHHAFAMAKITSVVIGKSVISLKTYAFFNCNKLTVMEVKSAVPPKVGSFVFMGTPIGKAKLIVPAASNTDYQKNKDWKKFGNIENAVVNELEK